MGTQFSRVGPSKNRFRDRLRTTTARENAKNQFRHRLRTHFYGRGTVFVNFSAPAGSQKSPKTAIFTFTVGPRSATFRRSCSKCLPKALRTHKMTHKDRKSTENCLKNRSQIDRTIRHGMLAKCRRTLPKIKHKLRGDTLGNPIRTASYLRVRRSRASVFNPPPHLGSLVVRWAKRVR